MVLGLIARRVSYALERLSCRISEGLEVGEYERAGEVSDQEAKEMFLLAKDLREGVEHWLRSNFPDLL